MKLIISSPGDMTVGIFPETWEIDCPFDMDAGSKILLKFKTQQEEIYQEFCDDARGEYDFEAEERQRMEDEAETPYNGIDDFYSDLRKKAGY